MTDVKKQEHFCRLQLLSTKGVTPVLVKVVESICAKNCNGDLDKLLSVFKKEILILKKKKIINIAANDLLFPLNGKTDINTWDISLLTCILLNFCTLEGRCIKDKLIKILEQEFVNKRTDINSYLATNRSLVDQNGKRHLNEEQYKQLYPNSGVTINIETLDFEVLLIVLSICTTGVRNDSLKDHVKSLLIQEIELSQFNRDLVAFLKKHSQRLTDLRQNGIISNQQYELMFPSKAIDPDINVWDQSLLVITIINICPHLQHSSINAIKSMRSLRNEKLAHTSSQEITEDEFKSLWTKLVEAIEIVIENEVHGYTLQEWNDSISSIRSGPLNKEESIDIVKEWYQDRLARDEKVEQKLDNVCETLKDMDKEMKEIKDVIKLKQGI